MKASGFTHVSVHANDLEESARFYKELFRMEEVPAPDFSFPVRWFRVGDLQLHLFQSDSPGPSGHHFGLDVDDFESVYEKARKFGIVDGSDYFSNVYELPGGAVQLYLRDPAGNMVEVNWPDVTTLDRSVGGGNPEDRGKARRTTQAVLTVGLNYFSASGSVQAMIAKYKLPSIAIKPGSITASTSDPGMDRGSISNISARSQYRYAAEIKHMVIAKAR